MTRQVRTTLYGRLVASGATRRTAADVVSLLTGVSRKQLYDGSL